LPSEHLNYVESMRCWCNYCW